MKLTANSRISIQRGSGTPTVFGVFAQGLGSWSFNDSARTREVPSLRLNGASELLDVNDGSVGFNIDDNAQSAPLLFLQSGQEFTVIVYPDGNGSGKAQVTLVGVARIQLNNAEGGTRSYRFDLTASSVQYGTVS